MTVREVDTEGRLILVVDDDHDFREIISRQLQRSGWSVGTAGSAEDAFSQCLQRRPDLILMDVQMPGGSGIQACTNFRQASATAQVPIILMSAHWRDEHQLVRAFDSGADDVLAKEQSGIELLARVKAVLAMSDLRQRIGKSLPELGHLREFLAVCAACKRVRGEDNAWEDVELYLRRTVKREITHGICPGCRDRLYGRRPDPDRN